MRIPRRKGILIQHPSRPGVLRCIYRGRQRLGGSPGGTGSVEVPGLLNSDHLQPWHSRISLVHVDTSPRVHTCVAKIMEFLSCMIRPLGPCFFLESKKFFFKMEKGNPFGMVAAFLGILSWDPQKG